MTNQENYFQKMIDMFKNGNRKTTVQTYEALSSVEKSNFIDWCKDNKQEGALLEILVIKEIIK